MPEKKDNKNPAQAETPSENRTEAQVNQDAVLTTGVSDSYTTRPTTLIDLERRQKEQGETREERRERFNEQFNAAGTSPFAVTDQENTENLDEFVGVDPIYKNYGGISHKPFAAEEGPEAVAERQAREAMAEREENSRQASGGFTTYGPAVEVDPVGRTEDIVRGGTGDTQGDRDDVRARQEEAARSQAEAVRREQGGVRQAESNVRQESRASGEANQPAKD